MTVQLLSLEEVGERAESGSTEPYICRLSDDQSYVVKGRTALPRGLIAEAVSATLGRAFGLPVPAFALVEMNPRLFEFDPDARRSLGEGIGFGSQYVESLIELGRIKLEDTDQAVLARLFLFDYWISNADRTGTEYGGNSNLFMNVETRDIVVVDHNLAFDQKFDSDGGFEHHICRDFWFNRAADFWSQAAVLADMEKAIALVDPLFEHLPKEWTDSAPTIRDEIDRALARYQTDAFWAALA